MMRGFDLWNFCYWSKRSNFFFECPSLFILGFGAIYIFSMFHLRWSILLSNYYNKKFSWLLSLYSCKSLFWQHLTSVLHAWEDEEWVHYWIKNSLPRLQNFVILLICFYHGNMLSHSSIAFVFHVHIHVHLILKSSPYL